MKNLDGKEERYAERVFGRDENDQGIGEAFERKLLTSKCEKKLIFCTSGQDFVIIP